MRNLRRFVIILLVVCSVFILASCKSCSKDKDPKAVPTVSNPDSSFLQIGNYKISKKEAYYQLLVAYGLEALLNEVDDATLPAVENEDDFQEYLDDVIYGDEEKSEELLNEYLEDLTLSGLSANPEDENYYVNHHRLVYRRLQYAKSVYKSEMTDETFSEEDKKNAFESNYRKENELIIIRFNSQKEANDYLKAQNIDLNNVNNGWIQNGTKLEDVKSVFTAIYNEVNGLVNAEAAKTYKYSDLTEINGSLANAAYNLPVNGYTKVATTYGSYVYLVYKVSETGNLDSEGNEVTYEAKANDVIDILVDGAVSSTYATKVSLENHIKHNLKIYDLGLENVYKTSYNSVYEALGYEADEYEAFKTTEDESSTVLFSYELNGTKVEVTADDVYNSLAHKYGNYIASLYLKQYIVLKDNAVYNIETGAILDQETYDEYYEAEVTEYKEAFEKGDYASLGYPSSYGWTNFVRDYLGLLSEEKILINLDSTLYTESLDEYKEQFYLNDKIEEDEEGNVLPVDNKVQLKMEEIFNAYFSATAIGIKAYIDKDFDGQADEIEDESSEKALLNELIELVFEKVSQSEESIDVALSKVVLAYNTSSKIANNEWSMYRAEGVQLEVVKSASFSAATKQADEIKEKVKASYDRIIALEKEENGAYDISGKDLSKYATLTNEAGVTKTFTSLDFVSTSGDDSSIVNHENTAQLYFVTKASSPAYIDEEEGTYKPTYIDYTKYLADNDDVTSAVKTCITTYYIPAINELANETIVTNTLVDDVLEILNSITYADKDSLGAYLEACKIVEE